MGGVCIRNGVNDQTSNGGVPCGQGIKDISLEEQSKSLDAERLHGRFEYGRATGMKEMDLWGVEYWYYRKVKLGDASVWDAGRDEFRKSQAL